LAVVATAVVLALAGCGQATGGGATPSTAPTTTAPADPLERINEAGLKLGGSSFAFTIDGGGVKGEGVRHAPSQSMQLTISASEEGQEFSVELIQIGNDVWMKMDLGLDPGDDPDMKELADALGGWTHVTKEAAAADVGALASAGADAMGGAVLQEATDLKETSPGVFTGTIDLTKNPDIDVTDEETLKALGDKAKNVPITITLDSEGRLSSFVFDIPAAADVKAQKVTMKFFDFDNVKQPTPPPADQVKER